MNALYVSILLQLLGIIVVFTEIIIPSAGLLSIIAVCSLGYSIYLMIVNVSVDMGIWMIIGDLILIPIIVIIGFKWLAKSSITLHNCLKKEDGVTSQPPEMAAYLGKEGIAASDLRPSGIAKIDNKRLDVVTRGEYIYKGTAIEVIAVKANQIIVTQKR
ncbi:MAG: serine protease [Desulfobacterales bacterium]|nr:serine protease [Desulfobacterales bacterium]